MPSLTHYSFRSVWHVEADPGTVFDVLADLVSYPAWWPEVREVHRSGELRVATRVRSFLPYDLDFELEEVRREPASGILEVRMTGDLEGFSRWTVSADGGGARLVFEEEADTAKRLLNRLAPLARQAFKLNHAFMMRHGEAGLRTYMAGFRRGVRGGGVLDAGPPRGDGGPGPLS
jgi:hypothetical protein